MFQILTLARKEAEKLVSRQALETCLSGLWKMPLMSSSLLWSQLSFSLSTYYSQESLHFFKKFPKEKPKKFSEIHFSKLARCLQFEILS